MKLLEIVKVVLEPHWKEKDISDAARGFAIAGCDDEMPMELKAFLEIYRANYLSGEMSLAEYAEMFAFEIRRAYRGR